MHVSITVIPLALFLLGSRVFFIAAVNSIFRGGEDIGDDGSGEKRRGDPLILLVMKL